MKRHRCFDTELGTMVETPVSVLGADLSLRGTFLALGIDELSVSLSSVLPLRAKIRKSIAKSCDLDMLKC